MDRVRSNPPVTLESTTAGSDRPSHSGTRPVTAFLGRSVASSNASTVSYDPSDITVDYSHLAPTLGTRNSASEDLYSHVTSETKRARLSHYFDDDPALLRADLAATRAGVPARMSGMDVAETTSYTDMTESEQAMPCVDEVKKIAVEIENKLNIDELHSILVAEMLEHGIDQKYADLFENLTNNRFTRMQKLSELMNHVKKDEKLARCFIDAVFKEKEHLGHGELRSTLNGHGFSSSANLTVVSTAPDSVTPVITTRICPKAPPSITLYPVYPRPVSRLRTPALIEMDPVYPRPAYSSRILHQSHASPSSGRNFPKPKSTHDDRSAWLRSNAVVMKDTIGSSSKLSKECVCRLRKETMLTADECERLNLSNMTSVDRMHHLNIKLPRKGSEMPAYFLTVLYEMATENKFDEDDKNKLNKIMKVLCESAEGSLKEDVLSVWRKISTFLVGTEFAF